MSRGSQLTRNANAALETCAIWGRRIGGRRLGFEGFDPYSKTKLHACKWWDVNPRSRNGQNGFQTRARFGEFH